MAKTKGAVDTKKRKKRRVLSAAEEAERHRKSQATKEANRRKKDRTRPITQFIRRGNSQAPATSETINVDDGNNSNGASSTDNAVDNQAEVATNRRVAIACL